MPENASRAAALYDQFENEHQVADWGGDELFTRMPRPRAVDDSPPPRFRPSPAPAERRPPGSSSAGLSPATPAPRRPLALVEPAQDRRSGPAVDDRSGLPDRRPPRTGEQAMLERAERLGLSVVEPAPELAPAHRFDESGAMIDPPASGRPTKVITGRPDGAPRPLPTFRTERRRPARTPAEWIGPRPERIVAWAFVLGLLLILIAITTA